MPALDIHVVVNDMPTQLEHSLAGLGFSAKEVVGGDPRVVMRKLFSKKFDSKDDADLAWNTVIAAIQAAGSFVGYVEEEIITDDVRIDRSPDALSPIAAFGESLSVAAGPEGRYKGCDIHASMVSPPAELSRRLLDAGFYYLVLRKPGLGDVTIFTVQTEHVPEGRRLLKVLVEYLRETGMFEGMVKFEVTRAITNFGFALPPIVLAEAGVDRGEQGALI